VLGDADNAVVGGQVAAHGQAESVAHRLFPPGYGALSADSAGRQISLLHLCCSAT
jgi:hypothetical protein